MRRFTPSPRQVVVFEALAAAIAYSVAMLLRFVDEPGVPETYAVRTLPWAVLAAGIHVLTGRVAGRLRKPGARLADRPILPFLIAAGLSLALTISVNYVLLPLNWRLPFFVAVFGPILASAASAALRIAADRKSITAEDLLPRKMVELDVDACAPAIRGKRILITGAAGSIGSELARQVLAVHPASLTLLDVNESGLYEIEGELTPRYPHVSLRSVMGDVTDDLRVEQLFQDARPEVVFHAAAYKHVPLVESNPGEGFHTNVLGTLVVCRAAVQVGAERVVVISTDKAVNPTSFMGLTKRVAELIVAAIGSTSPNTVISAVRFGNVLGSRGSLVPTLLRQIESGGPVTITDRDARRYFMTIPEAASLVIRSAAFADPGAIFVLEMGEDLRILDLAERLVRLKGLRPGRDVPFVYIGLRPGEKLREELAGDMEDLAPTDHPYVRRVVASYAVDGPRVLDQIRVLAERRRSRGFGADGYPIALRSLIADAVRPVAGASAPESTTVGAP